MSKALPAPAPLPCHRDVQGLYVVFLDAGIPLRQTIIPTNQLPLSASQLEALALKTILPDVSDSILNQGSEERSIGFDALGALEAPFERLREQLSRHLSELAGASLSPS